MRKKQATTRKHRNGKDRLNWAFALSSIWRADYHNRFTRSPINHTLCLPCGEWKKRERENKRERDRDRERLFFGVQRPPKWGMKRRTQSVWVTVFDSKFLLKASCCSNEAYTYIWIAYSCVRASVGYFIVMVYSICAHRATIDTPHNDRKFTQITNPLPYQIHSDFYSMEFSGHASIHLATHRQQQQRTHIKSENVSRKRHHTVRSKQ